MEKNNIYPATPLASPGEVSIDLFRKGSVTIERIISHVHSSPAGFWYDQAEDEWVIVLRGSAVLEFGGGEMVEMKPRAVTIHSLAIRHPRESVDPIKEAKLGSRHRGNDEIPEITLEATVSKGTYIRSLARDIARELNTVGHVTMLRRTRAGPFDLDRAVSLDFLAEIAKARRLTETVLPLEAALDDIPALPVTPGQAQLLRFGQRLAGFPEKPGLQLATEDGSPVALVEATADGLKVVRGFNL